MLLESVVILLPGLVRVFGKVEETCQILRLARGRLRVTEEDHHFFTLLHYMVYLLVSELLLGAIENFVAFLHGVRLGRIMTQG